MKHRTVLHFLVLCLLNFVISSALANQKALPPKYNEADLRNRYEEFLTKLDYIKVASDYPKAIKDLLGGNSEKQLLAIKMFGESGEPTVIPWLVPFLDSEDNPLRIWSGVSIQRIIETCALSRRDPTRPEQVILRPLGEGELDLRPFAWIALKMFRKADDGNTHAYAATIIRYLEVREFEDELRRCLRSNHPAVSNKAKWALEELGLESNFRRTQQDDGGQPATRPESK